MKIRTYPIQFMDEYLQKLKKKAALEKLTLKDFILEAIEEKMNK